MGHVTEAHTSSVSLSRHIVVTTTPGDALEDARLCIMEIVDGEITIGTANKEDATTHVHCVLDPDAMTGSELVAAMREALLNPSPAGVA